MTHGGRHNGRASADAALIAALASGSTARDAAKSAGVAERTVFRRLDDSDFRRQVEDARAALVTQTVARLTAAACEAVDTLRDLLDSEQDFARLGAARAILEIGLRYREHEDLAARVAALEAQTRETTSTMAGGRPWAVSIAAS